jgi:hypothetical protein
MRTYGRTDMTKLTGAFEKVPKNSEPYWWFCVPNLQQTIYTYLNLQVRCPKFFVWFLTKPEVPRQIFRKSPGYKISRKSIQGQQRWCMRSAWRTRQSLALFATIRTRLKKRMRVSKVTLKAGASEQKTTSGHPGRTHRERAYVITKLNPWFDAVGCGWTGEGGGREEHVTWITPPAYTWS